MTTAYTVYICVVCDLPVLQLQAIAGTQVFKLETGEIITCTWHFLSLNLLVFQQHLSRTRALCNTFD